MKAEEGGVRDSKRCYFYGKGKNTCWYGNTCPYIHDPNRDKAFFKKLKRREAKLLGIVTTTPTVDTKPVYIMARETTPNPKEGPTFSAEDGPKLVTDYKAMDWPNNRIHCIYYPNCTKKETCPYLHSDIGKCTYF
jgi:hypothetical protein